MQSLQCQIVGAKSLSQSLIYFIPLSDSQLTSPLYSTGFQTTSFVIPRLSHWTFN